MDVGKRDEAMTAPLMQIAKQGAEARDLSRVKGSVWTDRMLSAPVTVSKEAFGIVCRPNKFFAPPSCSPWARLGGKRDSPDEETIDWRAVCGKTARTVRREGRCKSLPYPYQTWAAHLRLSLNCFAVARPTMTVDSLFDRFCSRSVRPVGTSGPCRSAFVA